jgi:eukaryotic-like serine/threonine-protein kinase
VLEAGAVGSASGSSDLYYTMPFVPGETLRVRLDRELHLGLEESLRIARQVAETLTYAHARGVVHRDIKPENILLSEGHAVVADFGIARAVTTAGEPFTQTDVTLGTPHYMSPEQADAERPVDGRSDLYSLACVVYEMLGGQPPFTAPTTQAVLTRHALDPVPSLRSLRPSVPGSVERAIVKALAKVPADRFATPGEFIWALERIEPEPASSSLRRWLGSVVVGVVLLLIGLGAWLYRRSSGVSRPPAGAVALGPPKSVAVIPYNIGRDSTTDYYADGIADQLISLLGQIPGLRVTSRPSAFAMKGKPLGSPEIGRRLGVAWLVSLSVQLGGSQLRVRAELVEASRDSVLWTGEYRGGVTDVLAMQDSIGRAIATALRITLAGSALTARGTLVPGAQDAYLRGQQALWGRREGATLRQAIALFDEALARDSNYAQAWAARAEAYSLLAVYGSVRPRDAFGVAKPSVSRALALDPALPEAHAVLGLIHLFYDWDFAAADWELRRARELNPSLSEAHHWNAFRLLILRKPEEGLEELQEAQRLDPESLLIQTRLGVFLLYSGRYAEAEAAIQRALAVDSTYTAAREVLARIFAHTGRATEALSRHLAPSGQANGFAAGEPGYLQAVTGMRAAARASARALEARAETEYVPAEGIAAIYAGLGDKDRAFAWLDRAYRERSFSLAWVSFEKMYQSLWDDPRYDDLIRRIGLPLGHLTPPEPH